MPNKMQTLPAALKDAMEEADQAELYNGGQHQKKRAYLLALSSAAT